MTRINDTVRKNGVLNQTGTYRLAHETANISFQISGAAGTNVKGITYDNGSFWMVHDAFDSVFCYFPNGTQATNFSVNTTSPYDVMIYNNTVYVSSYGGTNSNQVLLYYLNGTFTGRNFTLTTESNDPHRGLEEYRDKFYITTTLPGSTCQVEEYYTNFTPTGFTLGTQDCGQSDVVAAGDYFYTVFTALFGGTDLITEYNASGTVTGYISLP